MLIVRAFHVLPVSSCVLEVPPPPTPPPPPRPPPKPPPSPPLPVGVSVSDSFAQDANANMAIIIQIESFEVSLKVIIIGFLETYRWELNEVNKWRKKITCSIMKVVSTG